MPFCTLTRGWVWMSNCRGSMRSDNRKNLAEHVGRECLGQALSSFPRACGLSLTIMISSTSCYPFSIALNTLEIAIAFAFGCSSQSYDRQGAESTGTFGHAAIWKSP